MWRKQQLTQLRRQIGYIFSTQLVDIFTAKQNVRMSLNRHEMQLDTKAIVILEAVGLGNP